MNALAFSSDEDAFKHMFSPKPSTLMEEQLRISSNQLIPSYKPLPKNMESVKREKRLAIVVTEMNPPFKIVHVNSVWEDLCGWTQEECRGKTLGVLQGKETDVGWTSFPQPFAGWTHGGWSVRRSLARDSRWRMICKGEAVCRQSIMTWEEDCK
jgi:hypothetical protein